MDPALKARFEQHGRGWMKYPDRGSALRLFYKAPLLYWRLGFGPLLRRFRMLVLTTRGRKTGRPRHTMLEHDVFNGHVYLAPGWGERTQWYLNIVADPHVTILRGGPAESAFARRISDPVELRALYHALRGRSPVWKQYLDSWGVQDTEEDFVAKRDRLITLRLDASPDLPPLPSLKPDLVWVWPAAAVVGAIVTWLLLRKS